MISNDNKRNEPIDLSGTLNDSGSNGQLPMQNFYPIGTPKVIQWVIKCSGGSIKNREQASYVIFGFVALMIIISLFLIFGSGGGISTKTKSPKSDIINTPQPREGTIPR